MVKPCQQFNDVNIYLPLISVVKCLQANQVIFFGGVIARVITAISEKKLSLGFLPIAHVNTISI